MLQDQYKKINTLIGLKIKALREEQGISQSDLAKMSNISSTYLSLLENGKRNNISLTTLYMICDALHIKVNQLLCISSYSADDPIDTSDSLEMAEAQQVIISDDKILLSFYPEKYNNNKISSLLEFVLYLPLIDETMLYDALNAIQGHFLGNEIYICKRINSLIKRITDSPAKKFADEQLNLIHQKRDKHIADLEIQEGDIDIDGYEQYINLLQTKLHIAQLNSLLNNLQKEIKECTNTK